LTGSQRRSELRTPIERIGAIAGLDLDEFGSEHEAFRVGKAGDDCPLGFDAQPDIAGSRLPVVRWPTSRCGS
jgi:hypothetical protein